LVPKRLESRQVNLVRDRDYAFHGRDLFSEGYDLA
jgi:hypothetical protein